MRYSLTNGFLALLLVSSVVAGCVKEDFEIIVSEEKQHTVYDPWYPDDPQEDKLELVEVERDAAWPACVTVKQDLTYGRYFTRDFGLNGCDGVYTTELPDGNIFWSFGDSFFGMLSDPTLRIRGGNETNFPRNAIMIQTCQNYNGFHCLNELVQIDDPFRTDYYKGRTFLRHPDGEQTEESIAAGGIDQNFYYWPGDATVIERDGKRILQVLWGDCFKTEDGGMGRKGTILTEYDISGKPGDGSYMKEIRRMDLNETYITNYGSAICESDDGHTYLYGDGDRTDGNKGPVVARTKEGHDISGKWEYWVNQAAAGEPADFQWQDEAPDHDHITRSQVMDFWGVQPNVFKHDDGYYYWVIQEPVGREVWLFRSENPWGPLYPTDKAERKQIFTIPDKLDKLGDQSHGIFYNVFVHHGLSQEGELVISYNCEAPEFTRNFNEIGSADFYKPRFFRIYGWDKVFD